MDLYDHMKVKAKNLAKRSKIDRINSKSLKPQSITNFNQQFYNDSMKTKRGCLETKYFSRQSSLSRLNSVYKDSGHAISINKSSGQFGRDETKAPRKKGVNHSCEFFSDYRNNDSIASIGIFNGFKANSDLTLSNVSELDSKVFLNKQEPKKNLKLGLSPLAYKFMKESFNDRHHSSPANSFKNERKNQRNSRNHDKNQRKLELDKMQTTSTRNEIQTDKARRIYSYQFSSLKEKSQKNIPNFEKLHNLSHFTKTQLSQFNRNINKNHLNDNIDYKQRNGSFRLMHNNFSSDKLQTKKSGTMSIIE